LFSKAWLELHIANEIIQHLDIAKEKRQLTPDKFKLRKDLKAKVLGLATIEKSRHRQASRVTWLKEGHACTWFFLLKANGCSRRNYIPCLKKGNGEYAWTHDEKEDVLFSYF
jgi:hypothetical protein